MYKQCKKKNLYKLLKLTDKKSKKIIKIDKNVV